MTTTTDKRGHHKRLERMALDSYNNREKEDNDKRKHTTPTDNYDNDDREEEWQWNKR